MCWPSGYHVAEVDLALSLNAIADASNKHGNRTARGKEWTHVQVGLVLRRARGRGGDRYLRAATRLGRRGDPG